MATLFDLEQDVLGLQQQVAAGQSLINSLQTEVSALEALGATYPAQFAATSSMIVPSTNYWHSLEDISFMVD